jgi:hypothetical protein
VRKERWFKRVNGQVFEYGSGTQSFGEIKIVLKYSDIGL